MSKLIVNGKVPEATINNSEVIRSTTKIKRGVLDLLEVIKA